MHSNQKNHCSTKLSYLANDRAHGIDVEFIQTQEHLKVYLNVHSIPVPAYRGNSKSALVNLKIDTKLLRFEAYRLEGGQRLVLPDEIAKTLIEALKNDQEVTLSVTGYRSSVKTEDFSTKFDRLEHPFPLQNPFYLPL